MNSQSSRDLRHHHQNHQQQHQSFHDPRSFPAFYGEDRVWERLGQPSVLVPLLVLLCTIVYHSSQSYASSRGRPLPPLADLLWDALVFVTPAGILYAIDSWVNPPLFPIPMLQAQPTTHAAKSDVMRRVLGLDKPGGIVASVSQASRRTFSNSLAAPLGFKGDSSQPAGLGNWDNSCYQNSILQSLASLRTFPRYLAGLALQGESAKVQTDTAQTLRDLINDLNDSSNNGKTLWTPAILKSMSTWQQQDAQEYFSKLLDEIDREIAKATKAIQRPSGLEADPTKDDSASSQHSDDSGYQSISTLSKGGVDMKVVRNPLEGLLAQRVACTACGYSEGLSMIPFNCLTLNLGMDKPRYDIYERLDHYVHVESIQGVECGKCTLLKLRRLLKIIIERSQEAGRSESDFPEPFARLATVETALEEDDFDDKTLKACKIGPQQRVSSTKTKQAVIARPPQSLAIHMNRSVFDENTGQMFKNLANVKFPTTLDLGPWCLGSADAPTAAPTSGNESIHANETEPPSQEQWLLDPKASMVAGDLYPSKITGPIYELRAVITHYGRHENGHYVCYRKHPRHGATEKAEEPMDKSNQPPQLVAKDDSDDVSTLPDEETVDVEPRTNVTQASNIEPELQWWRLSDQDVTQVTEEFVLDQGGVFMLFYDCVDPNSVLTSEVDKPVEGTSQDITDGPFVDTKGTEEDRQSEAAEHSLNESRDGQALFEDPATEMIGSADELLRQAQSVPLPSEEDDGNLID